MLRLLIVIGALSVAINVGAKEYLFKDYPAQTDSNRALKTLDYNSHPDSHILKDKLELLIGRKANFSGKYILAAFGCGTACQVITIVDVDTGKIAMPVSSSDGSCYLKDSNLLIINPYISKTYDEDLPDWAFTYYYIFEGGHLKLLHQTKEPFNGECQTS